MLFALCLQSRREALELAALCAEDGEWGEDIDVGGEDPFLKAFLEDSWEKEEWETSTTPPKPVGEATQEAPELSPPVWDMPPLDVSSQLQIPSSHHRRASTCQTLPPALPGGERQWRMESLTWCLPHHLLKRR